MGSTASVSRNRPHGRDQIHPGDESTPVGLSLRVGLQDTSVAEVQHPSHWWKQGTKWQSTSTSNGIAEADASALNSQHRDALASWAEDPFPSTKPGLLTDVEPWQWNLFCSYAKAGLPVQRVPLGIESATRPDSRLCQTRGPVDHTRGSVDVHMHPRHEPVASRALRMQSIGQLESRVHHKPQTPASSTTLLAKHAQFQLSANSSKLAESALAPEISHGAWSSYVQKRQPVPLDALPSLSAATVSQQSSQGQVVRRNSWSWSEPQCALRDTVPQDKWKLSRMSDLGMEGYSVPVRDPLPLPPSMLPPSMLPRTPAENAEQADDDKKISDMAVQDECTKVHVTPPQRARPIRDKTQKKFLHAFEEGVFRPMPRQRMSSSVVSLAELRPNRATQVMTLGSRRHCRRNR